MEQADNLDKINDLEKIIRNKDFNLIIEGAMTGQNKLQHSLYIYKL